MNLLQAMAQLEGWGKAGTRATRNNNPGNIEWGGFAQKHGATHIEEIPKGYTSKPRYAFFPDIKLGWAAMRALMLGPTYRHLTVREAIYRWSPPAENDTEKYIKFVVAQCGCTDDTKVSELLKEEGNERAEGMERQG